MLALTVIVAVSVFNPVVLAFTAPLCVAFVLVRQYNLATSRDVKRLEGISESINTHILSLISKHSDIKMD